MEYEFHRHIRNVFISAHGFASADNYNALKKKMLKSVYQNGGFYVGRYEAGITTARESSSDTLTPQVIQANAYPYNFVKCSQAQSFASTKFATEGYTTSLMFGVQWDLVLKYLETLTTGARNEYSKLKVISTKLFLL